MQADSYYQPEMVIIRKDFLYAAQESLRIGIESMQEELARHDEAIGRDRPRGKRVAEEMERNIAEAQANLANLSHSFLHNI